MEKKVNKYKGPVKEKLKAIELLLKDNAAIEMMVRFTANMTGTYDTLNKMERDVLTQYVRGMLNAARC